MNDHRPQPNKRRFFFAPTWERSHKLSIVNNQLPLTDYRLPITVHRFPLLTCLLILLLASCAAPSRDRRVADVAEPTPIPTAVVPNKPTYEVQVGDVVYTAKLNGRVAPVSETALSFAMGGEVAEVFVERGDTVLEGAEIARLDTTALERELALAYSALEVAQSRLTAVETINNGNRQRAELSLALAQLDLDFATEQAGEFPSADQTYQINRLTLLRDLAQVAVNELSSEVDPQLAADVQQAELRVAELESAISSAVLAAPTDGVLLAITLSPGKAVAADEPVGTLADPADLEISTNLDDFEMEGLTEGMPVTIALANSPGETFTGFIRQMPFPYGTRGSSDVPPTDTTTRITFDNPDDARQFETGDRMSVQVVIEERPSVLWLQPAAIRDFNGRKFVVIQDEQGQSRVDVLLGIEGDGRVEILEGLTEGQIIIGQ